MAEGGYSRLFGSYSNAGRKSTTSGAGWKQCVQDGEGVGGWWRASGILRLGRQVEEPTAARLVEESVNAATPFLTRPVEFGGERPEAVWMRQRSSTAGATPNSGGLARGALSRKRSRHEERTDA